MHRIIIFLIALTPFALFISPAAAANAGDILINEFSSNTDPEWIELYNNTDAPVSLVSWKLKDAAQSAKDISSLGEISAHGFKIFEAGSGWLNNSGGDTLTLLDNSDLTIDTFSYGHAPDPVGTPAAGKSAGRNPDGSGNWQIFDIPTKGLTNNTSTPTPSPSPSPTPSPKSPSPTTSSVKSTSTAKSPTPNLSPQAQSSKTQQATILGQRQESTPTATPSSSPSLTASPAPTGNPVPRIAILAIGSGLILIGSAIGFYLWYAHKKGLGQKPNSIQDQSQNEDQ